jgi:hypothetical protein
LQSAIFAQIFRTMAVTRLKRKTARNKIRAKKRVADIKRLSAKTNIKSPYKDVSGIILEDESPVVEAAAAPVVEETVEPTEEVVAETTEEVVEEAAEETTEETAEETPAEEA